MKTAFISCILFLCSFVAQAQLAEPVKWSFKAEKVNGNDYKVTLTASIEEGWYVYSQDLPSKGPIPTQIKFEKNPQIILEGKTEEVGTKKEDFDQNFNMTVTKLVGQTTYFQKVVRMGDASVVKGSLFYMTCNGQVCMPPKRIDFNISLN
jgi:Disulphide bond corrector protein DsbC